MGVSLTITKCQMIFYSNSCHLRLQLFKPQCYISDCIKEGKIPFAILLWRMVVVTSFQDGSEREVIRRTYPSLAWISSAFASLRNLSPRGMLTLSIHSTISMSFCLFGLISRNLNKGNPLLSEFNTEWSLLTISWLFWASLCILQHLLHIWINPQQRKSETVF